MTARVIVVATGKTGPSGTGNVALDDVTDVTITAAASGDILRHNGTAWVDTPGLTHFDAAGAAAAAQAASQPLATVLTNTTAAFTTAQETKLSGIETSATADQSAAEILTAIKTVDGAASGLDADLLDGIDSTGFATAAHNHTGTYQPLDAVLTATTASFTTADETKLDGITAGAIAGIRVEDEGVSTVATATALNFAGAGVTVTDATGGEALVTIPGGTGATNLAYTAAPTNGTVTSDTGTDATVAVADGTNAGLLLPADFTKLAGIETAATADQTAAEILAALLTVDGAASLLDADLLDGNDAAAFATAGHNHAATYQPLATVLTNTTASFLTADETKLDGIEAAADVTDATNVAAAGAVMESDTTTLAMGFVVDEDDMISDLATMVPTQQSVKAYVTSQFGAVAAVLNTDTSTASMAFVIDEDTMASDLATKIPTQQSVKAYVDAATPDRTIRTVTGTTDNFVLGDNNNTTNFSNAGAVVATVLPQATTVWLANTELSGTYLGAASLTLAGSGAAVITPPSGKSLVVRDNGSYSLVRTGTDAWSAAGDFIPADGTGLNSTTTRPGLLRKLSNIATEYMNAQGAWATPATNLGYTAAPTNGTVTSDTGTDATVSLAGGTNAGLMAPADFTKLGAIEAAADVTDATNVAAAGAVMEGDTTTAAMSFVIDEDSFTSNLATKVPTQQSVKAYVDANAGGGNPRSFGLLPTNAISQTVPRWVPMAGNAFLASGKESMFMVWFDTGETISTITFMSGATAMVTGTNQWFSLRSSARAQLGITADDTSTAWAATTAKTLTLATPYVTTAAGYFYLGIMVAATTPPNLVSLTIGGGITTVLTPAITGYDNTNTGLTNPASAPATSAALTSHAQIAYAYAS